MEAWTRLQGLARSAAFRFCLRTTVAALVAFSLMQFWSLPLRGLWAVLTAVVVMQMSVGGSLRATTEYVVGTFCGAVYASALGMLVPHTTLPAMIGVLALAVAPLAYLAALSPSFRVAPFTAILVLLLSGQFGQGGPVASALTRLGEVVLGGIVAVLVSIFVLPERAHGLGLDAAKRALDAIADALAQLLGAFTQPMSADEILALQDGVGEAVSAFQKIIEESQREQLIGLAARPDPGPLSRTLLRLRHDLVILGRAASAPLPDAIGERLASHLASIGVATRDWLRASGDALVTRAAPPDGAVLEAALDVFAADFASLRREGLIRPLSGSDAEQLFALSFALEQLRQNFRDLARCIADAATAFGQ